MARIYSFLKKKLLYPGLVVQIAQEDGLKHLRHSYKINKKIAAGRLKNNLMKVLYDQDGDLEEFCDRLKRKFKKIFALREKIENTEEQKSPAQIWMYTYPFAFYAVLGAPNAF